MHPGERKLRKAEVAEQLGISEQEADVLIRERRIPVLKISRKILRVRQADLDAFVQANTEYAG